MVEHQIAKIDEVKQFVFGWANVSINEEGLVIDSQDMIMPPEELENAAYGFVLDFRQSGEMHVGESKGNLIESFISTPEKLEKMGLAKDALPLGWWVGFHVPDKKVFEKVKDGTYKMFSIQGTAVLEEVD
jgi:hypothetical protein